MQEKDPGVLAAFQMMSAFVDAFLGANPDGTYQLPIIEPEKIDLDDFVKLLDLAQGQYTDMDVYDMNWLDMQEDLLTRMVATAVTKLRLYALTTAPDHELWMTNRELLTAVEIAHIGK